MSCRNGSPAAASSMRCSPRGGACSRPSALCSTFSLGSAPSGASWPAAQHHDQCTHASPLSGYRFGSPHRTDRCGALFVIHVMEDDATLSPLHCGISVPSMSVLGHLRLIDMLATPLRCPLYPRKQTSSGHVGI